MTPLRIGFLGFDGVMALDLVAPIEAFTLAGVDEADEPEKLYETVIIGVNDRPFQTESGVVFLPKKTIANVPQLDTLFIPGGYGHQDLETQSTVARWINERAAEIRRIATVRTGTYALAASGLLKGRRVTTHWRYAKELVVYLKRSGGEQQFSEPLRFQTQSHDRFGDLAAWIKGHLRSDLTVEALASRTNLSSRHFLRRFKAIFGATPAEFVENVRLSEACDRLMLPDQTVDGVAYSVGFRSADGFRRAFERRYGLQPRSYRKHFAIQSCELKCDEPCGS